MVPAGTVPVLEPLTSENLFVAKDTQMGPSSTLGTLTLNNSISAAGAHLDLVYGIDLEPANVLYAVEWVLSTDAPGVMDSDSIYAILSPDGSNIAEKCIPNRSIWSLIWATVLAEEACPWHQNLLPFYFCVLGFWL